MSKLVLANKYFKSGDYRRALKIYVDVASSNEILDKVLRGNIAACRRKLLNEIDSSGELLSSTDSVNFNPGAILEPGAKVLFISHDASLTGAPAVLISIASWLKINKMIIPIFIVGGESEERIAEFSHIGRCLHIKDLAKCEKKDISNFIGDELQVIYVNTVASGKLLQLILNSELKLSALKLKLLHVHEKQGVIDHFMADTLYSLHHCDKVISDAKGVGEYLRVCANKRRLEIESIPPFIIPRIIGDNDFHRSRTERVVFGCGTIESRKGFDIFCETIYKLKNKFGLNFKAIWIGASSNPMEPHETLRQFDACEMVECVGKDPDPQRFYKEGDIFFMSSREDPFPLVCLQAADSGMPIVCFDSRAGDIADFVGSSKGGLVCEYLSVDDAAKSISILLQNRDLSVLMGRNAREYFRNNHTSDAVMPSIVQYMECQREFADDDVVSVIVVSFGPLPILDINKVEGGGLRSWGMAKGMASIDSCDVTVTFPEYYSNGHSDFSAFNEIKVITWRDQNELLQQISAYKVVIFSYCYGDYSDALISGCRADQIAVLDCYVPIHIEVCARVSDNTIAEYVSFKKDSRTWLNVFSQGDLILCSNAAQRDYYRGMQLGLGLINPINYDKADNIIIAPFGVDILDDPQDQNCINDELIVGSSGVFNILWFGGVYPWFDIELIIEAVKEVRKTIPCTLTIVGAKNPFNSHPDFLRKSEKIVNLAQLADYSEFIFVKDWVDYNDRGRWYHAADLLVTMNKKGIENGYAWRTRALDYLSFGVPFATNGGDPLTDFLFGTEFCYHLDDSSLDNMTASLMETISLCSKLKDNISNKKLDTVKERLNWRNIGWSIYTGVKRLMSNK